ncbi:MAG: hypothetical protein GX446_08395 [Chthonomonadales bacterium]|nr:hypothetical protein [Chthonomonadales bacterium]
MRRAPGLGDAAAIQYQSGGLNCAYTGVCQYDLASNLLGGAGGWTYNSNNQVTPVPATAGISGAAGRPGASQRPGPPPPCGTSARHD